MTFLAVGDRVELLGDKGRRGPGEVRELRGVGRDGAWRKEGEPVWRWAARVRWQDGAEEWIPVAQIAGRVR